MWFQSKIHLVSCIDQFKTKPQIIKFTCRSRLSFEIFKAGVTDPVRPPHVLLHSAQSACYWRHGISQTKESTISSSLLPLTSTVIVLHCDDNLSHQTHFYHTTKNPPKWAGGFLLFLLDLLLQIISRLGDCGLYKTENPFKFLQIACF